MEFLQLSKLRGKAAAAALVLGLLGGCSITSVDSEDIVKSCSDVEAAWEREESLDALDMDAPFDFSSPEAFYESAVVNPSNMIAVMVVAHETLMKEGGQDRLATIPIDYIIDESDGLDQNAQITNLREPAEFVCERENEDGTTELVLNNDGQLLRAFSARALAAVDFQQLSQELAS